MLSEEIGDLWICSCGNWVGQALTWCPECCEDRDFPEHEERETTGRALDA